MSVHQKDKENLRRTKIVCTLGPAVATKDKIAQLVKAGMNVARINCSHGSWETRSQWIQWLKELRTEVAPVGILVDLQGPKFRIGELRDGELNVEIGQVLTLGPNSGVDIPIMGPDILSAIAEHDRLLFGDGDVEVKIFSKIDNHIEAKALSGGVIKTRQGLTLVGKSFDVSPLTEKDLYDVEQASKFDVDFIALSYVRSAADMLELRRIVDQYNQGIQICAKIETHEAVNHIDEIIKVSNVIMVARGDLGLQMDIEDVPIAQKKIISRCSLAAKPVITATQMLESMIRSARPTRAEATDVANAILDGSDGVMLSAETASGNYPIEAVRVMSRIAEKTERIFNHSSHMAELKRQSQGQVSSTEAVAMSAAQLGSLVHAKAIVTTSTSGTTPRKVSKFRPSMPIFCASWNPKTHTQMSMVWGVQAVHIPVPQNTDQIVSSAVEVFSKKGLLHEDDMVVVTAGIPAGTPGHTNLIVVQTPSGLKSS